MNLVSVVLALLGSILLAAGAKAFEGAAAKGDEDNISGAAVAFEDIKPGAIIFVMIIQLICYAIGAYGAVQFNVGMVSVAMVCHIVSVIGNLVAANIPGVIMIGLFIYPHVFFIKEMRAGVMTPDNYVNEVHSCCCV